ncbi:MAG: hypothetical protein KatS3mg021_1892 [Fimbriimonadales bacterium]|nr:MAG: hypothetical protein KatS3mg021_1892 [Fimbriimonadales bacterium]
MALTKAIVPMAGLGTRLYPVSVVLPKGLMPFVLADGRLVTGLQLIAESLLNAGIRANRGWWSRPKHSRFMNSF